MASEAANLLKPCPFCGHLPEMHKHFKLDAYSLVHRCPILGPIVWEFTEHPDSQIAKWNTRAA
jgi:hypothetical protein